MTARFEWRLRQPKSALSSDREPRLNLVLPALAAVVFIAWLVIRHIFHPAWLSSLPQVLSESLNLLESAAILTVLLVISFYLWRRRRKKLAAGSITAEDLYALSPRSFERYVADLFCKKGYKVTIRGRSGDHGVDLELESTSKRRAIVQCKRYRNAVGPDIVRELFGTMIHEGVHHAFLVTTADITPAARNWARNKPMTLIDGQALVHIAKSLQGGRMV
jgi:restriction system protein